MKKILMALMIISLIVATYSCALMAYGRRVVEDDDNIFYTVERIIVLAHFKMPTEKDIIFTKVFSKNKSTQQQKLLFEVKEKIYNLYALNDDIYILTRSGVYKCSINGENQKLILEGNILGFTLNGDSIFYCLRFNKTRTNLLIKCDLDGNNKIILTEKVFANKLSVLGDELIYSYMGGVGKISGTDHVTYVTNYEVPMPGGVEDYSGRHFIIDDKIIISGYAAPEEYKEYGRYPTIILDLNGKVINVWENSFVRHIEKSNGKIYAQIDTMKEYGISEVSKDLYYILDDFTDKHLAFSDIWFNGFRHMYVKGDNIYFTGESIRWFKGDILYDGSIDNIVAEPT
jgi:hypothetical protein